MTSFRLPLLDLLAIGRVSNLPTVWSNVLTGYFLAWSVRAPNPAELRGVAFGDSLIYLAVLLVGATGAYLFGTFLNDWHDAEIDRSHRPERAIPSGRVLRPAVLRFAIVFAAIALACFAFTTRISAATLVLGGLLLASIVFYTIWHKKSPAAIIPMGICRSLLYLLGFCLIIIPDARLPQFTYGLDSAVEALVLDPLPVLAAAALGIFCYVAGLTLAARHESGSTGLAIPSPVFWFLVFLPFFTHTWWWLWRRPPFLEGWHLAIPALIGLVPFLLWTIRAFQILPASIPGFVSRSLAGLCLVDLLLFPGIAATIETGTSLDSYSLLLALLPLALFLIALVLQRIAPAT